MSLEHRGTGLPDYDFRTLSPMDFELLVCDLMRHKLGYDLQAFAHGPDGGVDLRYRSSGRTTVVQCKHYRGSSFSDLRRAARSEKSKMESARPDEYYLVTSQDLTLTQKLTLVDEISPFLEDAGKVIALRDLNQMLGDYPNVEENHFKLWMASSGIIRRIVQSGIWERSAALMEEIQDRVRLYVATPSYSSARNMLRNRHVCVITGAPGVGKSMLADMISLTQWEKGWQIISLQSHELDKCWDAWDSDKKQLFYFDDVFGQTDIHERLARNSGNTLARLVRRIGSNKNKQLVITTRTHILREVELRDEPIARSDLRAQECIVSVREYDRLHRARILYNHLYFCNLSREVIKGFVANRFHLDVIGHQNFTPRLVEQSIRQGEFDTSSEQLRDRVLRALDHPVLLWGPSFTEFLSETARRILLHLVSFPLPGAPVLQLRAASIQNASHLSYTRSMVQLEGSWIRITSTANDDSIVSFSDPSCRDFILSFLESEPGCAIDLIENATDAVQISQLLNYSRSAVETDLKYPSINRSIVEDRARVREAICRSWESWTPLQCRFPIETLHSLLQADRNFNLDLKSWIAHQALQLGSRFSKLQTVDTNAMGALAALLPEMGCSPTTSGQFRSTRMLLLGWWSSVENTSEWDLSLEFLNWLQQCGDEHIRKDTESDLKSIFDHWLERTLDSILDNATDINEAEHAGATLKSLAQRYFSIAEFSIAFETFQERISNQREDILDPEDDDADEDRPFGACIEKSAIETPWVSPSRGLGYESREDRKIKAWFSQLS
nr:restriction endonuclease [Nocardia brasiliensis]